MDGQCLTCETPIGVQLAVCDRCGAVPASRADSVLPYRLRYNTRTLLLTMTALAPTFMLSPQMWEQILMALAIGTIATAVGLFLTRSLIDGAYRLYDRFVRSAK